MLPFTGNDTEMLCTESAAPPTDGNTGTTDPVNDAPVAASIVKVTFVPVSAAVQSDSQMLEAAPQSATNSTSRVHVGIPLAAYAPENVTPVMGFSDGVSIELVHWSVYATELIVRVMDFPVTTCAVAILVPYLVTVIWTVIS